MTASPFEARSIVDQVRERILAMIDRDNLEAGDKLPSERVLAAEVGVSRPTLREALRLLESEGRVIRHVGLGTFVGSGPQQGTIIDTGLEQLLSYTEMMEQSGHRAGSTVLGTEIRAASDAEAQLLGLEPDSTVLVLRRVRTLDGIPASYSEHITPTSVVGELSDADGEGSVFALVEARMGMPLAQARTHVIPVLSSAEISGYLGLDGDAILLLLDEVIYNTEGTPVILARSHFRPDVHRYHIVRTRPGFERR